LYLEETVVVLTSLARGALVLLLRFFDDFAGILQSFLELSP